MVLGKSKTYKKKGRYFRRAAPKRRGGKKSGIVSLIKKVLRRQAEVKTSFAEYSIGFGSVAQSNVLNVRTLSPSSAYMPIIQGTAQDERIGNSIQTKKVTLKYTLFPLPHNATTNTAPCPMDIIIWIGKMKRSTASPTSTDFQNLLQYGSASVGCAGDLSDVNASINTDYFTVTKKIVHKLGFSSYDGSGANVGVQYYQNNDYKYNVIRTVDLTKHFAKHYTFNDNDNDPQNSRVYMWLEAVRADGVIGLGTNIPVLLRATLDYKYTDV